MDVVAELEAMRERAEHTAVSFSLGVDEDHGADEHRRREYLKIANAAERQIYALRQAINAVSANKAFLPEDQEIKKAAAEHKKQVLSWLNTTPGSFFGAPPKPKENPFYPK